MLQNCQLAPGLHIWTFLFLLTFSPAHIDASDGCFDATSATSTSIRDALLFGGVKCRDVVQAFLDRIEVYNRQGPKIGAVLAVSPNALAEADTLDAYYEATRLLKGPLHCVPLLVKDNIDVAGMPTTGGLFAFKDSVPQIDAETVRNAREAGVIVIGKANMSPLADKEAWGNSETGGLIRNPYGINYTTYGSSGGNGAAGAAMFTVLGFGTETGVSVNLPSSAANLVGLRAPVSLLSQEGVLPNSGFQDVVGPMAKTVKDVVLLLDAMISPCGATSKYSSQEVLRKDGLKDAKINIFKDFTYSSFQIPGLGNYTVDPKILSLFDAMVEAMKLSGATVSNKSVNMVDAMTSVQQMMSLETTACVTALRNAYFANPDRFDTSAPYHSIKEVVDAGKMPKFYGDKWKENRKTLGNDTLCDAQAIAYLQGRRKFISTVIKPILEGGDLVMWPAMPEFPPLLEEDALNRDWGSSTKPPINMILAGSWSAYATINVPMGFSDPFEGAPDGLPVGAILLAAPNNLDKLLRVAFAYQEQFGTSILPASVPP